MSTKLSQMTTEALQSHRQEIAQRLKTASGNRMALDLTRGKPAPDQLHLSDALDGTINGDYTCEDGTDARNYGGLRGIPEARALGAELLQCPAANVMVGGNSSLHLMYLMFDLCLNKGLTGSAHAWLSDTALEDVRMLTPVPGYDRHFALTESFGVEMTLVDINEDGPDMDAAEKLVASNPNVKGIWCVPKYSNPTGCIYSPETVARMANLPNVAAAENFAVFWDNAYAVHDLFEPLPLAPLSTAANEAGTEDHILQFASTSKITFAGAGLAFVASSESVLASLEKQLSVMTIGFDKVNQLRHARFLKGELENHMRKHAALLRPKFELVLSKLEAKLAPLQVANWSKPQGGYFVSLDVEPGLASSVVAMAKEHGLALTAAGATFPHGSDPEDKNIRIAPTYASMDELDAAMDIFAECVLLASYDQEITQRESA